MDRGPRTGEDGQGICVKKAVCKPRQAEEWNQMRYKTGRNGIFELQVGIQLYKTNGYLSMY